MTPTLEREIRAFGNQAFIDWQKAFGSDWSQSNTVERSKLLTAINTSAIPQADREAAIAALGKINRKLAFRLLGTLPIPLLLHAPQDLTEDELNVDRGYWLGVSMWLLHWDLELPGLKPILDQRWKPYEVKAQLSMLRYAMIRHLVAEGQLFPELFSAEAAPAAWLLAEAAECRQRLMNMDGQNAKKPFYQQKRQDISELMDIDAPIAPNTCKNFDELIFNFDRVADWEGRDLATRDRNFDKIFYRPYMIAARHWNRLTARDPEFQPIRKSNQRDRKPSLTVKNC